MKARNLLTAYLFSAALAGVPCLATADTFGSGTNEFTMDFVDIGIGATPDNTGFGAVQKYYRIGIHEVSERMIGSYNALSGAPAITLDSRGPNQPATNVSWNEAARFVNWLNTSTLGPGTEAYKFTTGGVNDNITTWTASDPGFDPANPFRNSNALYFLPSEDEWYRAAYFDPNAQVYWDYATGSDNPPTAVSGGTEPGTAVYGTQSGPADVSNAGGPSPHMTFAQNGNAFEWLESAMTSPNTLPGANRVVRGGAYGSPASNLTPSIRLDASPGSELSILGFRVASVPEPSGLLLAMLGGMSVMLMRKRV